MVNLNQFIQVSLAIFTYTFVFSGIILLISLLWGYKYTHTLSKKVYNLGKGITAEDVEEFRNYLDAKYIPFRFYTNNLIKAGYRLIQMDENIDQELKQKLKIMTLSKGILVD